MRLSPKQTFALSSLLLIISIVFGFSWLNQDKLLQLVFKPTRTSIPSGITTAQVTQEQTASQTLAVENSIETQAQPTVAPIQVVATNVSIPWDIAFLPDGSFLVTERPGQLTHIYPDQKISVPIEGVAHIGEGGLQGMALDPQFTQNNWVYLYLTSRTETGLINRVERYRLDQTNNQLLEKTTIIDTIPGAQYHDGGRIAFGPDNRLYIATGDATQEDLAQDLSSLAGKILRINRDGSIPEDNPFDSAIYSYGHRNIQGLAWDDQGRLWATEHGPSGFETGHDEVNLIQAGNNYGWPTVRGDQQSEGLTPPVIHSGDNETWAPAGITILDDQLFFVGLRGEALYQATIEDASLSQLVAHFRGEYGRLRFVRQGPDGWFYLGTSNQDGRGTPTENDDRIIKINPALFQEK